jgi:hypothetical protein
MIYTDRHGNNLQITFGQGGKTNGQSINYQQWPTISNPWMYQARMGNLFIYGTNRTIVYNFNNWTETTNNRPVLAPVSNQVINAGVTLLITNGATDADQPPQTLTFGLAAAPANAAIATNTGILSWRPAVLQAGTTNLFGVTVADNGTPSLSATQNFTVIVNPLNRPKLTAPAIQGNRFGVQVNGDFGPDYTVESSTNLTVWTSVFTTNSPALPFNWTETNPPVFQWKFFRLKLGP